MVVQHTCHIIYIHSQISLPQIQGIYHVSKISIITCIHEIKLAIIIMVITIIIEQLDLDGRQLAHFKHGYGS